MPSSVVTTGSYERSTVLQRGFELGEVLGHLGILPFGHKREHAPLRLDRRGGVAGLMLRERERVEQTPELVRGLFLAESARDLRRDRGEGHPLSQAISAFRLRPLRETLLIKYHIAHLLISNTPHRQTIHNWIHSITKIVEIIRQGAV